jgi:hypothetical protein|tara:strand:- start:41 stop:394 length:354 start_codon:yes stop_codon:yes gene_type:complete
MTDKIIKVTNSNLRPNRKGRPKGARNKLSTNFLEDIHSYWSKRTNGTNGTTRGMNLLDKAAEKDPMAFCKMVASIIPKELHKENTVQVNFVEALKQINNADIVDISHLEDADQDDDG